MRNVGIIYRSVLAPDTSAAENTTSHYFRIPQALPEVQPQPQQHDCLTTTVLQMATVTLFIAYVIRCTFVAYRLPPGPRGYPIVGALPFLRKSPHLVVQRWWRQYGDICCLRMGSRLVVILNSVEMMKECFINQAEVFGARPNNFFKKLANNKGFLFTQFF